MTQRNQQNERISTATKAVQIVLEEYFEKCESLTLRIEKFVTYDLEREGRARQHIHNKVDEVALMCKTAAKSGVVRQPSACFSSIRGAREFALELQSRLLVNHSGGVIENSSLHLHRFFGVPMIPGSSLKGVARHYALQLMRQAANTKEKIQLLTKIALTFGWSEADWKEKEGTMSDFEFAGGSSSWPEIKKETCENLCCILGLKIPEKLSLAPWKVLDNFAGSVSFLPAIADCRHERNILEADLVNCHHKEYYQNNRIETAFDIENAKPNFFPAVRAGLVFVFTLAPVGDRPFLDSAEHLDFAEQCLQESLSMFGVGAKTNAGYGWFEKTAKSEAWNKQADGINENVADETNSAGKTPESLSPEEQEEEEYLQKLPANKAGEIKGKMGKIEQLPENEQKIICRLLAKQIFNIWEDDCRDAEKAKESGNKKYGKALRRVTAVRQIAIKVGVELP